MPQKVLEHCCFRKYLSSWYAEAAARNDLSPWVLHHFGDHLVTELIDWAVTLCAGAEPVTVCVAIPIVAPSTRLYLNRNRNINHLTMLSADEAYYARIENEGGDVVIASDSGIHIQAVTVRAGERTIVMMGGLLQMPCHGKYMTMMCIDRQTYDDVQASIDSFVRLAEHNMLHKVSRR